VRVPDRQVTLDLLEMTGPLAVTSANRSDEAPATTAAEAIGVFGPEMTVLDDGPLGGEVSTVLSLVGGRRVLRNGAVPAEDLARADP
jgi:tRNA A37 threonylcarbamoyladenosine synthetase subunit TsaC/SUA5/YrdC